MFKMLIRVSKYPPDVIFLLMPSMQILENAKALGRAKASSTQDGFVLLTFIEPVRLALSELAR